MVFQRGHREEQSNMAANCAFKNKVVMNLVDEKKKSQKLRNIIFGLNDFHPPTTAMQRRRSTLKRTDSQWENFILSVDVNKPNHTGIFKLTLHQLARDGETFALSELLKNVPDMERRSILDSYLEDGGTPLHLAARHNHYKVCELLIKYGADVNARGEGHATPLHYAAKYKPKKKLRQRYRSNNNSDVKNVITLLAASGANVNLTDVEGQTPLHAASIKGNSQATLLLLQCNDIDIKATDNQGMTALHMAATHGYVKIVKLLIEKGADLYSCDHDLLTPLHFACSEGNTEIVEMILEKILKDDGRQAVEEMLIRTDAGKSTCLHVSSGKGHKKMLLQLLEWMKKSGNVEEFVNMSTAYNNTALHIAATQGHHEIAEVLIIHGAKVDARNDSLATPLLLAAQYNYYTIVELLRKHKAEMETRDKDNMTPLLIAAKNGNLATISWLIENGADVTATDKDDKSCLMLAVEVKKTRAVQELLGYSSVQALLGESDKNANSVLHIAAKKGHVPIIKILVENGAKIDFKNEDEITPVHIAAAYGQHAALWQLLEKDRTMINNIDENANTALHLAAMEGHTNCIQILLNFGANVEFRNTRQWSALDCACANGKDSSVLELLQAQSSVNPPKLSKTTPLHQACLHGHVNIVKLLLKWKADLSAPISDGRNPLDCAIDKDHRLCVEAILQHENWKQALRNSYIDPLTGQMTTPMRKMIVKMPDMAELAFSRSISNNKKPLDDVNLEVTLDYEFLDDMYAVMDWNQIDPQEKQIRSRKTSLERIFPKNSSFWKAISVKTMIPVVPEVDALSQCEKEESSNQSTPYTLDCSVLRYNHPLQIMANRKRERLLQHPVVTGLLQHKWKQYGGFVYYSSLAFLLIFVALLNCYVLFIPPPFAIDYLKSFANSRFHRTYSRSKLFDYLKPPECYNVLTSGSDYRGFANVTVSGKTCIPWSKTSYRSDIFPEAGLEENYCRNPPELKREQPWCFTKFNADNSNANEVEYCNIAQCPIYVKSKNIPLGKTCHFPFLYKGENKTECLPRGNTFWCSYTDSWDRDRKEGNCIKENTLCDVNPQFRKRCGPSNIDRLNCEARGCCFETYKSPGDTESGTCFQKLDPCVDQVGKCSNLNKTEAEEKCKEDMDFREKCPKTCKTCNSSTFEDDHTEDDSEHDFLHLMGDFEKGTFDLDWKKGCYYMVKGAREKWGKNCQMKKVWEDPIRILLILLSGLNLLFLLFAIWNYNWGALRPIFFLKAILFVLTILLTLNFKTLDFHLTRQMIREKELYEPLIEEFQEETGLRQHWQWQCGAFALLLSWMQLLLYIRKTPYLGISVVMFNDVFKTFIKFSVVFLLFILSFAITFYILLQNASQFQDLFTSILKTSLMMTGEVQYVEVFHTGFKGYNSIIHYETVTYIIFSLFIVVMMLIIMNLLVGLAVGDIMEVKENASLERLKMQVDLALEVQFGVPSFLRKSFVRKSEVLRPNRYRNRNALVKFLFQNQNLSSKNIVNAMNKSKSETEEIHENVASLNRVISCLSNKTNNVDEMMRDFLYEFREMKQKLDLPVPSPVPSSPESHRTMISSLRSIRCLDDLGDSSNCMTT